MMDRLGSVLPRWPVLLPLGLILAGLPWLLGPRDQPVREVAFSEAPAFFPDGTSLTALPAEKTVEPDRPARISHVGRNKVAETRASAAQRGESVQTPWRETNVCPATEVPAATEVARSDLSAGAKSGLDAQEGPQLFSPRGVQMPPDLDPAPGVPAPPSRGVPSDVSSAPRRSSSPRQSSSPRRKEERVPKVVAVSLANVFPLEPDDDSAPPQPDAAPEPVPPDFVVTEARPRASPHASEPPPRQENKQAAAKRQPRVSRLPPPQPAARSEQLEQIARQADKKIRRGFELAGRRAYFAARAEFVGALRLISQGLDAQHRTTAHSRSLAAGLTALKEAEDFYPAGSRLEADLDLSSIIGGHRTPVLKEASTKDLTPMLALKSYFTFAQEQLASSAGQEVAGSMALHALGKLHAAVAMEGGGMQAAEPKAMTFYQAALLVCPRNYMASNDLGVLLARCGNLREAEAALQHSLSIHRQPTGWQNLATVYEQLGQMELARQARLQSTATGYAEATRRQTLRQSPHGEVVWVDPATFSQTGTGLGPVPERTPSGPAPPAQQTENSAAAANSPLTGWRIPWELFSGRK